MTDDSPYLTYVMGETTIACAGNRIPNVNAGKVDMYVSVFMVGKMRRQEYAATTSFLTHLEQVLASPNTGIDPNKAG